MELKPGDTIIITEVAKAFRGRTDAPQPGDVIVVGGRHPHNPELLSVGPGRGQFRQWWISGCPTGRSTFKWRLLKAKDEDPDNDLFQAAEAILEGRKRWGN